MKQQTLISEHNQKDFWIMRQAVILFILLAGTLSACTPGETSANLQEETSTPEVVIEPTATLNAEGIREQRLNEIASIVEENENTFTIEELNAYLQEYGTGWENGVESMIKIYEGSHAPFKYFFIENNKKDSGVYLNPCPYQHSTERTMSDKNSFATPKVINEVVLGKIIQSIYYDLYLNTTDDTLGWIKEPGKYTTIIYIRKGTNNDGDPIDEMYYNIGGYTFIDGYENVKYISLEKIINHELTDEEMALFSDRVLRYIQEGYTVFTLNKSGNVNGAESNFIELKALMDAAMLEQENSAEE